MKYIQRTGAIEATYEANTSAEIVGLINAVNNIPVNDTQATITAGTIAAGTIDNTTQVGETL